MFVMSSHQNNKKLFAILLIAVELIIIIIYGIFVRPLSQNGSNVFTDSYPVYQNLNAIILIGFGFSMAFIKNYSWSAISYTFFINAIIIQLYILWNAFWKRIFGTTDTFNVNIHEKAFTHAEFSVAAIMISFCGVLGRIGPLQLLIMALVQIVAFTLNRQIIYESLGVFDVGGTIGRHTFAAFFGITVSLILSRAVRPKNKPELSYNSNIFALLGTIFLWMYWPTANASHMSDQPYYKGIIITNTILAMTGSCISTFITTSLVRQKFSISDICNATLAGGVGISSACGFFTNPTAALCVGVFCGVVSTLSFRYLQPKLPQWIGLDDTCGIVSLHAIPGILGGIFSAIGVAVYAFSPLTNPTQISNLPFYPQQSSDFNIYGRTFLQQAGVQIAGIFISMAIGICFGLVTGYLMRIFYVFDPQEFYKDDVYFEMITDEIQQLGEKTQRTNSLEYLDTDIKVNISNMLTSTSLKTTTSLKVIP